MGLNRDQRRRLNRFFNSKKNKINKMKKGDIVKLNYNEVRNQGGYPLKFNPRYVSWVENNKEKLFKLGKTTMSGCWELTDIGTGKPETWIFAEKFLVKEV